MARALAFTYGSLTIGAGQSDSSYYLTGRYRFNRDYERASLVFEVVISNATQADFLTAESNLQAAYRKPDQALSVVLGGNNRHSFDPSDNSGFNLRASARKVGGQEDTGYSAKYECSVSVELPADLTGRNGRRSSTVNVATSPSGRRTATIQGVYTALSNNAARAQFAAEVDTYCNAVLSGLGGIWESVGTPTAQTDDQDKTIVFSRTYSEIVFDQSLDTPNHAALVNPRLAFNRRIVSAESTDVLGSVAALVQLDVDYSTSVLISETTDLEALWLQTVRPYILTQAETYAGGLVIVSTESPRFDPVENVLSATMTLMVDTGSLFLSARSEVSDSIDHGTSLKPVWNGSLYARDIYQGQASWVRRLYRVTLRHAGGDNIKDGMVISDHGDAPQFAGFVEVKEERRARSYFTGIPGYEIPLRLSTTVYTYVRADVVSTSDDTSGGTHERQRNTVGPSRV